MTYPVLSGVFLAIAIGACVAAVLRRRALARIARWWVPALIAAATLLALTAIFDNVMIAAGVMTYARGRTWGVTVGSAPAEDFAYPIAAVLLLPALWSLLGRGGRHDR